MQVKTSTTNKITCKTSAHGEGMVEVIVSSAGLTFEAVSYNYTASDTPTITSITPSSGYSGDTLTITGTALFTVADSVGISVGGVDCVLQSASSEEVVCTLGEHAAGQVEVLLHVDGLGNAAADSFTFTLDASSVSPSSGNCYICIIYLLYAYYMCVISYICIIYVCIDICIMYASYYMHYVCIIYVIYILYMYIYIVCVCYICIMYVFFMCSVCIILYIMYYIMYYPCIYAYICLL